MLKVKGLTKEYLNDEVVTPVLHGLDLAIEQGEFVALMGPSGSGKSTLMHILGFLDVASAGEYVFDGRDVSALSENERAIIRRQKLGFVFQAFHLLPRLTAAENIALPLIYDGVDPAERQLRARQALARVGLSDREDFLPSQLSGGQKQRVAIARALVNNPTTIFADEPTGNLDSVSSEQVLKLLRSLNDEGRTIVMVTHEMEAAAYAKRIVRLKDGRITSEPAQPLAVSL